jgi:mono/diheme cytochrome c family protein
LFKFLIECIKKEKQPFYLPLRGLFMKKALLAFAGVALIGLTSSAFADEKLEIGAKIYERAFGRGCGTCHEISSNPQLFDLVKSGKLTRASFEQTLQNGKGGMPKAIAAIMEVGPVKKAGYGEDQAVDALYAYLGSK